MNYSEDLVNLIHAEVMRVLHRTTRRTPVKVSGYDKKTHAVKLKLMPESNDDQNPVETGWIPLHTFQTGEKSGFYSPPNINDHGWLEFSDDDREGGTFTHAAFNDKFPPDDTVEAGELKYVHPATQSQIYFSKDGTITIRGQNTSNANGGNKKGSDDNHQQTFVLKADGTTHVTDKNGQSFVMDGNQTITTRDKAGSTVVQHNGAITLTDAAGSVADLKNDGNINLIAGGKIALVAAKISLGDLDAPLPVKLCDDSCATAVYAK